MEHTFDTPSPVTVYVEIGSGLVNVHTADVEQTVVHVTSASGEDSGVAREVEVAQRGDQIAVVAPRRISFLGGDRSIHVDVTAPTRSNLVTRLGSADLVVDGTLGSARLAGGSGDVTLDDVAEDAVVKSGSGVVRVGTVAGAAHLTSGSGDLLVDRLEGAGQLSTGSGDILVGHATQQLSVKTGSGDVGVREAAADATLSSASGDVQVGRFPAGRLVAKNVSGDISVGIPAGVPVWTDVSSTSGSVRSTLEGAGEPEAGQEYVEVRARTVSGDVVLQQI